MKSRSIRVAILGVGNCASSLVQGVERYKETGELPGVFTDKIGSFGIDDIEFVLGIDIDRRKVGSDLSHAIYQEPNIASQIHRIDTPLRAEVIMGCPLDGVAPHMESLPYSSTFAVSDEPAIDSETLERTLRERDIDVLLNYLPVGSNEACRFYLDAALSANCSIANCMPFLAASDSYWRKKAQEHGCYIIGDDVKSQIGATILHRELIRALMNRGVDIENTYQISVGGNTDFANMLDRSRLATKRLTKEYAIDSLRGKNDFNRTITPADYIAWLGDTKTCFIRVEGRNFGGQRFEFEGRLVVEDSPNSAGSVVHMIRWLAVAEKSKNQDIADAAGAIYCKRPHRPLDELEAIDILSRIQH